MHKKTKSKPDPRRHQKRLHAYHDELGWDSLRAYVERKAAGGRVLFVDNVAVDVDQVLERQFMCDGRRCVVWRGADETEPLLDRSCCGRYSVPVTQIGEKRILDHLEAIQEVLPEDQQIESWDDIFEYDEDNQRQLQMDGPFNACVFRLYENGRSLCAVHKAALVAGQNPNDWKPITCMLWPLVADRYKGDDGKDVWFLSVYCKETCEVFEQDDDGDPVACIEDDDEEYPFVYESMRSELEHVFGREWYMKLLKAIDKHIEVVMREEAEVSSVPDDVGNR